MSLKFYLIFFLGMSFTQAIFANVPVEIIESCKNQQAVSSSVILNKMIPPGGQDDLPGCTDHFESTRGNFNFGAISCDDANYFNLILSSTIKIPIWIIRNIIPDFSGYHIG
jgi:hypothetical protein